MAFLPILLSAAVLAAAPTAPTVKGPRRTSSPTPVFMFAARERGVPAGRIRFRCAFDSTRLRACARRYSKRLAVGAHRLRVQAVDPGGRRSRVTVVRVVVVAPAPRTLPVTATVTVGATPVGVAFGAGAVWAVNFRGGSVSRIDPATNRVTATIDVGGQPYGIGFGDGAVWVGDYEAGNVTRIDPATNKVVAKVSLSGQAINPAIGAGSAWFPNFTGGSLQQVDVRTNSLVATIPLGGNPECAALAPDGTLWVSNEDGSVEHVDPRTKAVIGRIAVPADPDFLAVDGSVWVTSLRAAAVTRIDPGSSQPSGRIDAPAGTQGVATGGGSVWVSNYNDGTLLRIDPQALKIVARYRVGDQPRGVAVGGGAVWVANGLSNSVSRVDLPAAALRASDAPEPHPAVDAVLAAFATHPLVAIGELHEWDTEHAFLRRLIGDPRFAATVDDIVVEFGNARYQHLIDRYVLDGEAIPRPRLERVWTDTTQAPHAWKSDIYPAFFAAVRAANLGLPRDQRVRVLLGDPPIDWTRIRSKGCDRRVGPRCLDYWLRRRDTNFASVVRRQVLAKGGKALLVAGTSHVLHRVAKEPNGGLTDLIEWAAPGSVYVVVPFDSSAWEAQPRASEIDTWPLPSLAVLQGTWIGRVRATPTIDESRGRLLLQQVADALLYIGPN